MNGENAPSRRREAEDPSCSPGRVLELSADDNFFVRRAARENPALPAEVVVLWVRAGSTADLAGFGPADPNLPAGELARLVELGPWGARLAARHSATAAATLEALAGHESAALRADLASHPKASAKLLAGLLLDQDSAVRSRAAAHSAAPPALLKLLARAGDPRTPLAESERRWLAGAGRHGWRLLALRPELSAEECAQLAGDEDAEARRAVLVHPLLPGSALARAVAEAEGELAVLTLAAAHPAASTELLTWLTLHGPAPVRQAAAAHPAFPEALRQQLERAGASHDLGGFGPPDPTLESDELSRLAKAGAWARWLAARHPATSAEDLRRLLADADPRVRQAAAAHPRHPTAILALLVAAGASRELDGFERGARPPLEPERLAELASLRPWGRRLAAGHPQASPELLEGLSQSEDAQVRAEVGANPQTRPETLLALAADLSPAVRWAVAKRAELSAETLAELAKSPEATLRAQVAGHPSTPPALRKRLALDPDEDVRAASRSATSGEATHLSAGLEP